MANARVARFITEVAPPQLITVMRQRTCKMMETIHEEEKECGITNLPSSLNARNSTKHLLKVVQKSFSVFRHDY
ncbi:hypothetical protein ABFS82_08G128200 [Erythranthe guttata]